MKKQNTFFALFLAILVLAGCGPKPTPVVPTPTAAASIQPLDSVRTLTVGGMERSYIIHVPAGLTSAQLVPLVFVFHGYSENAEYMQTTTGFDKVADANGFIVVYPNGSGSSTGLSWNATGCCGYAVENNVDDAAFVRQMIADVGTIAHVDPKRIYSTGFSNGALLSYRLACEMSDTLAAVAPVAGVLLFSPCQPTQPVSLLAVNGLKDTAVPFDGGMNGITGLTFPPVQQSIDTWVQLDGCAASPQVEEDKIATHTSYSGCQAGTAVELYALAGTGHAWPSPYLFQASQTIWDFFAAHPKQ